MIAFALCAGCGDEGDGPSYPLSVDNPVTIELPANTQVTLSVTVQSTFNTCLDGPTGTVDENECPPPPPPYPPYRVMELYLNRVTVDLPLPIPDWSATQTEASPATIAVGDTVGADQPDAEPLGESATFTTGSESRVIVMVEDTDADLEPDFQLTRLWMDEGEQSLTIFSEGHPNGDPFHPGEDVDVPNVDVDGNDVTIKFTW